MSFDRNLRPDPLDYFRNQGLNPTGRGKWRGAACLLHGGSDSFRVNTATGGWCCMACGEHGGDVLAFHMRLHGLDFIEAAKALGCWVDDGRPPQTHKPTPLPPRQALEVLNFETSLVAVAAANIANGVALTDADRQRLLAAAGRINTISRSYAS